MMWSFRVFLLAVSSTFFCVAEEVELKVYTGSGEDLSYFSTKGLLIDESGVLVMGLPNSQTIFKVTYQDQAEEVPTTLVTYDNYSRIAFITLPQEKLKGKTATKLATQSSGEVKVKGKPYLIAGEVTHHDGQAIPFSFTRIHGEALKTDHFPFVKDAQGQCTGIFHSEVLNSPGAYYVVPAKVIQKNLADIKKFGSPVQAWLGITLDANVSLPIVKSVRPLSAAAKAGLQKGDILKKMETTVVRNYDDALKFLYLAQAEKEIQVQVVRGAEALTIQLTPQKLPGSGK